MQEGAARDVPYGELFIASEPRRYLENLTRGRGWEPRVLTQAKIEARLDKVLALRGEHKLNELRDACRTLAEQLGLGAEFKRLDGLIGALLGTHEARSYPRARPWPGPPAGPTTRQGWRFLTHFSQR